MRSTASSSCASAARTWCGTSSCRGSSRHTTSIPSAGRGIAQTSGRAPGARSGSTRSVSRALTRRTPFAPDSPMLEVELFGTPLAPGAPPLAEVRRLCALAAATAGVSDGHLAVEFVDSERIARLNAEHRGHAGPTDVLSFPIDLAESPRGLPHELGDVVICAEHTSDLREAMVHGVLHLVAMDTEPDDGQ